jgi:uncharacterized protein (TIGR02246 family)
VSPDERAIRDVIATWMEASLAGDSAKVLSLMTDDVVFLVAGRPPFGKKEFAASQKAMAGHEIQGTSDVQEVVVSGNMAYARSHLTVAITSPKGVTIRRRGPTLSIFRREADGCWRLARDANLLTLDFQEGQDEPR